MNSHAAAIKNLEVQIGQIAKEIKQRPQGNLPSDTTPNPREQVHAIMLRSGKEILRPEDLRQDIDNKNDDASMEQGVEHNRVSKHQEDKQAKVVENESKTSKEGSGASKEVQDQAKKKVDPNAQYREDPKPPFPSRFENKKKLDRQFSKFLDVFKKLHINIPFIDALEQMPSYVKFMKEILANKKKLEKYELVALTEECSAILQHKLPPKLKDPGSFTIPCSIGNILFEKALCDLGASINLMPYSMYRKLGIGEVKPTTISLQMANRSIKHPRGIVEDVLVKVDKFLFPMDFVVLDMDDVGQEIPLIFGRPFLATSRALIDVQQGELTLRVGQEKLVFNIYNKTKFPKDNECFEVEVLDESVTPKGKGLPSLTMLGRCFGGGGNRQCDPG